MERVKMKAGRFSYILMILGTFSLSFCGRDIAPSSYTEISLKKYDVSSFNYVYVEAIKQKLMGNSGDALKYLEQCIRINPESDASYYQMAQILVANGDIRNGKKFAAKALSINQKNMWYLMMLAGLYYQEKNLDSSIICYEQAVKFFPENSDLQMNLGNLYSENSNFEKAQSVFDGFDFKYGVNESSTVSAIKNMILAKKFEEALLKARLLLKEYPDVILYNGLLAEIYRGKGENEKALEVYRQLIERNPENPQTQLALCDFLITEKSYDELFILLNTVVLNIKVTREEKISLCIKLIELPDLSNERGDKLVIGLMVLEANYKNDDIIPLLRPEYMIKKSLLVQASERLEEIINLKPDNYYAWEKLLLVYLQMGDFNKLLSKGEECATRFNRSFLAKVLYANGALENGKYAITLEELRKAEILAGDNKDFLVQVLTMRADVYYRMKEYLKAFEIFEQALKTNKDDLTVINNYAYYLAEQNMRLKEAEEMAKKVIESEKDNNTFLDTYGWILYKRGKLKEAARVMESIINSGEKPDAVWFEHFGYILKDQKKCDKAIENWNIALSLDSKKTNLIREIENCGK
jgi:tetratricopeptide (TPR) repeat protein